MCDRAREEEGIAVACLYYDFQAQKEQTTINMMGAILKQLVCKCKGGIPKAIRQAFLQGKGEVGGRRPLLAELIGMLKTAIASIPRVFICVDALDECLPRNLSELLESLKNILHESPTTRIFLTGRPLVRAPIQKYFTGAVEIPISPNTDDVRNYLQMKLDGDEEEEAMDDGLREDIVKVFLDKMSDM